MSPAAATIRSPPAINQVRGLRGTALQLTGGLGLRVRRVARRHPYVSVPAPLRGSFRRPSASVLRTFRGGKMNARQGALGGAGLPGDPPRREDRVPDGDGELARLCERPKLPWQGLCKIWNEGLASLVPIVVSAPSDKLLPICGGRASQRRNRLCGGVHHPGSDSPSSSR
jgi:hypothetical protein